MPLNMFEQPLGFDQIDFLKESLALNLQSNEIGFLRAACNHLYKVNAVERSDLLEFGLRSYLMKAKGTHIACGYAISVTNINKAMNILLLAYAMHEKLNQKLDIYVDGSIDFYKDLTNSRIRMHLLNMLTNVLAQLDLSSINRFKKESPQMRFELNLVHGTVLNYRRVRAIKAAMLNQNLSLRIQDRHKLINLVKYYYF